MVPLTSSSGGYINGRNSSNLELLIDKTSHRNNGSKCVVLGYNSIYFSNKIQKGKTCCSEEQVISMLEFRGTIRTHWYAYDLLKQYPSKGDKYAIDEELQHTDHLFLGAACFTFLNFV
jgi:hypothetical protein